MIAPNTAALEAVRARLAVMRDAIIDRLAAAEHVEGGMLALLGSVGAAIDAIDQAADERDGEG